jgi:dihydropteroate synthase
MRLTLRHRTLDLTRRVAVMSIVNRTPDSFFDRGRTYALEHAVEHALAQVAAGADLIDVGGVKAGPGAEVDVAEELDRIVPFVEAFRARSAAPLSVDTFRPEVADAALAAGADLVNDVSGLADPRLADVVAAHGAALVVMHAGGPVRTRPFRPSYLPDVTAVVVRTCRRLAEEARRRGVAPDRIVVDPGHDFGKNTFHSLEVTRELPRLAALGYPVLVALSRKDFLGETLGGLAPTERLEASLAAAVSAVHLGARILRVHDTEATVRAVRTTEAILGWRLPAAPARGLD